MGRNGACHLCVELLAIFSSVVEVCMGEETKTAGRFQVIAANMPMHKSSGEISPSAPFSVTIAGVRVLA